MLDSAVYTVKIAHFFFPFRRESDEIELLK